jgi:hypothetical protein
MSRKLARNTHICRPRLARASSSMIPEAPMLIGRLPATHRRTKRSLYPIARGGADCPARAEQQRLERFKIGRGRLTAPGARAAS